MVDPRLYRAAFVLVLLAVLVAAFSIENRPRPIGTTLATDAWDADRAARTLDELAAAFPSRRPGSAGDEALAQRIAATLRAGQAYDVTLDRFRGRTIDGERDLVDVVASRPGAPGPGLVIVAHRDAAGRGARAELSGTAALLELARIVSVARLRRTVTFVSTTGGSGGFAGARRAAAGLGERADAVLVLGDLAGARVRRPFVVGFSNGRGHASLRLRRTVEAAVRAEARTDPGAPHAVEQWARLAVPLTVGEQGPFVRDGHPAVLLSVSGERGPPPGAAVVPGRLEAFGRAALHAVYALDNGPDIAEPPHSDLVARGKVVPSWAIRLVVGALLLPPLVAAVDAFARARRRHEPVEPWLRWTLIGAVPFVLACLFAKLLAVLGLLDPAAPAPIPAPALEVGGREIAGMVAVLLAFALGWIVVRPPLLRRLGLGGRPSATGAPIAVLLCATVTAALLWVLDPYAAMLLVPAVHLWLLALAGGQDGYRVPRLPGAALVLLGLAGPVALVLVDARSLGLGPGKNAWFWLQLVAGGHVPVWSWLLWSVAAGCGVAALLVVLRRPPSSGVDAGTVRGPRGYAGPGSLGGTESALRR